MRGRTFNFILVLIAVLGVSRSVRPIEPGWPFPFVQDVWSELQGTWRAGADEHFYSFQVIRGPSDLDRVAHLVILTEGEKRILGQGIVFYSEDEEVLRVRLEIHRQIRDINFRFIYNKELQTYELLMQGIVYSEDERGLIKTPKIRYLERVSDTPQTTIFQNMDPLE